MHKHDEDCYEYGCDHFDYEQDVRANLRNSFEQDVRADLYNTAHGLHTLMEGLKIVLAMENHHVLEMYCKGAVANYFGD